MRHLRFAALLAGLAGPAGAPAAAAAACTRQRVAELPLRDDGGTLSVAARIDGQAARLVLDTGSDEGLLTEAGAARLGLSRRDPALRPLVQGTGGTGRVLPGVLYSDLALGPLRLGGGSLPLGALPGVPMLQPPVAGLLGADVLSRFDLELDVPHGRIGFWRVARASLACAPPPPWAGGYDTIPLDRRGDRLTLPARLDGRPITALLDSGARSRVLSAAAAARLGVAGDRLGADPGGITAGVDGRELPYHWHRFARLTIGHATEADPVLTVTPLAEPVDLLLGADWLAARDVWISYATAQLFVRPPPPAEPGP